MEDHKGTGFSSADGMCYGVAKNIIDTLFSDKGLTTPIIFTGGVSKNRAVVRHMVTIPGKEVIVDATGMYAAIGSSFLVADELRHTGNYTYIESVEDVVIHKVAKKKYFHDPLELRFSHY